MYLRETKRRNADGSVVSYLALAQNERDAQTGVPRAQIVHRFGRTDAVDRQALARLVGSISRFLDPADAVAAASAGDGQVSVLDSRSMGACWLADRLWERLGIAETIIAAAGARRLDAAAVERTIFSMVANRLSVKPLSKLAGCGWVADRAFVQGLPEVGDEQCYRAMDFLHATLPALQERVFFNVATLLDLEVDMLFFDTSSTYWQTDSLPGELQDDDDREDGDGGEGVLVERGQRAYSKHSKDHRPDLPQVVIGMAVTRTGIPVRVWTFPGNASDQAIIRKVKDDLRGWNLSRVIWVLDRGFTSAENRRYLQRAGGHYIVGEKLRSGSKEAALATKPAYGRLLRKTKTAKLRIDRAAVTKEAGLDGKFLLRTSDESLSATDIALGYKALYEAERGWRDMKSTIDLRPVHHRREDRIEAHVQLCWLALLLLRVAETETQDTWRNIRNELDRMHLVTLATSAGTVAQRTELTHRQRQILKALGLPEPARFYDFTPLADRQDPAK